MQNELQALFGHRFLGQSTVPPPPTKVDLARVTGPVDTRIELPYSAFDIAVQKGTSIERLLAVAKYDPGLCRFQKTDAPTEPVRIQVPVPHGIRTWDQAKAGWPVHADPLLIPAFINKVRPTGRKIAFAGRTIRLPNDEELIFFIELHEEEWRVDLIPLTSPNFGEAFWWWAVCP